MRDAVRSSWLVAMRHWRVYRKDFLANIAPTFADPIFFMVSLGIGLGAYVREIHGMPYATYIAPGLAMNAAMFTAYFETSYGFFIRLNYENIFKALLTTAVGVEEIIAGEFIWVGLKSAVFTVIVGAVLCAFGSIKPGLLPVAGLVGGLVGLCYGAVGLIATALVRNITQFQIVFATVINTTFFFSGMFFPLDDLPGPLATISKALPLSQGVALSQALLWQRGVSEALCLNGPVLAIEATILVAIASRMITPKLYR